MEMYTIAEVASSMPAKRIDFSIHDYNYRTNGIKTFMETWN